MAKKAKKRKTTAKKTKKMKHSKKPAKRMNLRKNKRPAKKTAKRKASKKTAKRTAAAPKKMLSAKKPAPVKSSPTSDLLKTAGVATVAGIAGGAIASSFSISHSGESSSVSQNNWGSEE